MGILNVFGGGPVAKLNVACKANLRRSYGGVPLSQKVCCPCCPSLAVRPYGQSPSLKMSDLVDDHE